MLKHTLGLIAFLFGASVAQASEANIDTENLIPAEEIQLLMDDLEISEWGESSRQDGEFQAMRKPGRRGPGYRRPPQRKPPRYNRPPNRRPPRYNRPPHRRPPRYRRPPHRRAYQAICYAQNARGQQFSWVAWSSVVAQSEAMNQCYRYSRRCESLGCYIY